MVTDHPSQLQLILCPDPEFFHGHQESVMAKKKIGEKIKEELSETPSPNSYKVFSECVILFCSIEITLKCKEISCPIPAGLCSALGVLIRVKYLNIKIFKWFWNSIG